MDDTAERPANARDGALPARVSGGLLVLLGTTNVVLAGLSLFTRLIRVQSGTAAVLGVLGLFVVVLGVFVLRRRRWAMVTSLVVFGGLFVVQAFAASGGGSAPALITLAVVLVPLVLAVRAGRAQG